MKIFSKHLSWRLLVISLGVFPGLWVRQAEAAVDPARLANFENGLSLYWFSTEKDKDNAEMYKFYHVTSQDLNLIKQLGFKHVRVCVTATFLFDNPSDPDTLKPDRLAVLDQGLDMVNAHGLAVIVSFVDHDGVTFQKLLANSDGTETEVFSKFVKFWNVFAKHLSTRNPKTTFLEILNEPAGGVLTNQNWMPMQEKLVAAARAGAPDHTIIASCASGSMIEGLNDGTEFVPLADSNVLYVIHNYMPAIVCAPYWYLPPPYLGHGYDYIHELPYPSNPTNVLPAYNHILAGSQYDPARQAVSNYGRGCDSNEGEQGCNGQGWDLEKMRAYLQPMKDWADRHNASVMMEEFGVQQDVLRTAGVEDRLRFLHDEISILEGWNIPWCHWQYRSGSGIERDDDNVPYRFWKLNPTMDDMDFPTIEALGVFAGDKQPPHDQTVNRGGTATFQISLSGPALTFEWQKSTDGQTWNPVQRQPNSNTYRVTNAQDIYNGALFRCIVKNSGPGQLTSRAARLKVNS